MSTPLFVLVVEIIVVLAGLVALLLFFRWKTKQIKTKALEELLEDMTSMEDSRQQLLFQHLQKGYALENKKANESSVQLIKAEKHFMQLFIQQQIEQSSISDFYQTLCELLDQYLNTIPTLSSPDLNLAANITGLQNQEYPQIEEQNSEQDSEVEEQTQIEQNNIQDEAKAEKQAPEIEEAEPDWDDAFSESGDEMDEASKESVANESAADAEMDTNNEEEEEVNWDEAFSESGDDMDEASKASFESETAADSEINANNEEEEINWDDAFSESGDTMDEASKQEMESEQKKDS